LSQEIRFDFLNAIDWQSIQGLNVLVLGKHFVKAIVGTVLLFLFLQGMTHHKKCGKVRQKWLYDMVGGSLGVSW
jgi:hypothetical protein